MPTPKNNQPRTCYIFNMTGMPINSMLVSEAADFLDQDKANVHSGIQQYRPIKGFYITYCSTFEEFKYKKAEFDQIQAYTGLFEGVVERRQDPHANNSFKPVTTYYESEDEYGGRDWDAYYRPHLEEIEKEEPTEKHFLNIQNNDSRFKNHYDNRHGNDRFTARLESLARAV